jgi:Chaperone of endosialidase
MKRLAGLTIAGLILVLGGTSSWGGPPNPTQSDDNRNTAGGTDALVNVTDGLNNTAFGFEALGSNTTGSVNTAIGTFALTFNTTGSENTACGSQALIDNTTGSFNTASGFDALANNTTGDGNTASGDRALLLNTTGRINTAVGYQALVLSTGNRNIAVGANAGVALTNGNRNIYLGNPGVTSESTTMRLGNAQTRTFIAGVSGTVVTGSTVLIDANGQLGTQLSSARYKQTIEPMGARSEGVHHLRPVTFSYTQDARHGRQYGLIAEEVATVYPELVTRTATGEVQAVRYQELIPMLVNELQRQRQTMEQQQRELAELRSVVEQIRGSVAGR